ncbi:hypothetical protein J056_004021 [Wallemia ichthyophaga EXF-994]|uniref:Uncharacterized protein n=1 Tax=Wallemia ichthyophaga (strain EXF-994 / CBS 113033) TaxID=1299270 RepID=R9AI58_WALI9|nr:uncharacterized protein J056_004021 [Wallemia ichthyophaga EXF-994]EOR01785.1 hypothetical protein J056_004021 [Wallemia ichthyophaga EXF-994]
MSIYSLLTHSITRSDTDAFTQPSSSSGSSNSNSVDTHLKALLVEMHNILNTLPTSLTNIYQEIQTDRQSELFNTRNLVYSFADDLNRRLHLSAIEQSKFNVQMLDEIKALSNRQLEINTAMMQWIQQQQQQQQQQQEYHQHQQQKCLDASDKSTQTNSFSLAAEMLETS